MCRKRVGGGETYVTFGLILSKAGRMWTVSAQKPNDPVLARATAEHVEIFCNDSNKEQSQPRPVEKRVCKETILVYGHVKVPPSILPSSQPRRQASRCPSQSFNLIRVTTCTYLVIIGPLQGNCSSAARYYWRSVVICMRTSWPSWWAQAWHTPHT